MWKELVSKKTAQEEVVGVLRISEWWPKDFVEARFPIVTKNDYVVGKWWRYSNMPAKLDERTEGKSTIAIFRNRKDAMEFYHSIPGPKEKKFRQYIENKDW